MVEDHPDDLAVLQQDCQRQYLFGATKANCVDNVAPDCITSTLYEGSSSIQLHITPPMVVEFLLCGEAFCSYPLV
jgi:hypothetical protein